MEEKKNKGGKYWQSTTYFCLTFILKALAKAEDQFKKIIEQYQEERFGCLAYYGIGKVYLRQNRLV